MSLEEMNLDKAQVDALKELCNIGMGHATTALAKLVNKTIYFDVPLVTKSKISKVPELIGKEDEIVVGIYLRFQGPITGNILFLFPRESVIMLRRVITGAESCELIFDEYQTSLLKELGNILAGSYLSVMEQVLGMRLVQSVPWFAFDLASAIIDPILIQMGKNSDHIVLIEAEFFVLENKELRGKFYLLPDPDSVLQMLKAIGLGV
jgi:chemotaxis protein CheC